MIRCLAIILFVTMAQPIESICEKRGKVRVVDNHADYKIRVVGAFPDVKVRIVGQSEFADDPGEWKFVESGEDFTVQIVSVGEDYRVQFVSGFSGCPKAQSSPT